MKIEHIARMKIFDSGSQIRDVFVPILGDSQQRCLIVTCQIRDDIQFTYGGMKVVAEPELA